MTTALEVMNRAAEIIGYKDPSESLSGNDSAAFLAILNDMLDGWNTQNLFCVNVAEVVQTVSGLPITIGPGAQINVTRPVRIEDGSFIRQNGADFGIQWVSQVEYDSILVKNQAGLLACYGYYDQGVPIGAIYLWPYPSIAIELHLQVLAQFSAFADLTTSYDFAPGYKKALVYSLGEELCPGRRPITPDVARMAANARRAIRRSNVVVPQQNVSPNSANAYAAFISGM